MEIRTLESTPIEAIHEGFSRAFSDYVVPMRLSPAQLAEIHHRRGVRLNLSVGIFDGDRLVGFTFNGIGEHGGVRCGYDAGTGVAPAVRGKGFAGRMLEATRELLSGAGFDRYVLEVIQSNFAAYRIYLKAGFTATRELRCWELDAVPLTRNSPGKLEPLDSLDEIDVGEMWDWNPSWQNSTDSVTRAREGKRILSSRSENGIAGYVAVFSSGEVAQFAVSRSERRRGLGTHLLRSARDAWGRTLRILNTDANDTGTTRFLETIGANETVRQYEMVMDL